MGLEEREGGNYITILNGKFCQRVKEDTAGAIQRTNKLGKTVWEKFYDSFTGKLVNIKTQDGAYGKQWMFYFKDKADVYILQLGYSNSFSKNIIKMLPNCDLTKEMRLSPSVKEVDGVKKSSIFINQDGVAIKHAYTKDNPNGLPQMKQIVVKGNPTWDDTEQMIFLEEMVMTKIKPQLEGAPADAQESEQKSELDELAKPADDINPEEIPF